MAQIISRKENSENVINVSSEFIEQSKVAKKKRKGGPYSKDERTKRQNEVYRLHFEYGYTARKIAELMNVNRNTINADLDYWYVKMIKNRDYFKPEQTVIINLERLEIQRTRLRESFDKTDSFQQRYALERLIYEIDSKILHTHNKLVDSKKRVYDDSVKMYNKWMEKNKKSDRYMTLQDRIIVSNKSHEKIEKIIKEEDRYRKSFK